MSLLFLTVAVGLASFALVSTMLVGLVAALWHAGLRRCNVTAGELFGLRLVPSVAAAVFTVVTVLPAFVRFEPRSDEWEEIGRILMLLALSGGLLLGAGVYRVWCAVRSTAALTSGWSKLEEYVTPDGICLQVIDVAVPIVAATGIWRSRVVIARTVLEVCTDEEIARVAAHERAHQVCYDNLKRLVLEGSPDLLSLLPAGRAIVERWHAATERAADERAVGWNPEDRLTLASALVKVARAALATPPAAMLFDSRLTDALDVEDRVRHLIAPGQYRRSSRVVWLPALTVIVTGCTLALMRQEAVHAVAEAIVGFWR
jgi:hypothetical protein